MFPSHIIGNEQAGWRSALARIGGRGLRSRRAPLDLPKRSGRSGAEQVVVREARAADSPRLRELAALESRRLPAGHLIVAELEGDVVAAVSLHGHGAVADPFMPTADLVTLLRLRAEQVAGPLAAAA